MLVSAGCARGEVETPDLPEDTRPDTSLPEVVDTGTREDPCRSEEPVLAVVTGARGELPLVAGDDLTLFWGGDAAGYVQAGLFALNVPQDVTLRMELTDDETGASMGRSGFDTFRVTLVPVAELGELDPDGPWTCRGVTSTLPLSVDPGALILEEGPPQGYFGRSVTLGFTVSVRDRDDRLEAIASTRLMLELAPP